MSARVRNYVELHFVSTKRNPMFRGAKFVPCAWHSITDAETAEREKAEAEARWPDVTCTIKPRRKSHR